MGVPHCGRSQLTNTELVPTGPGVATTFEGDQLVHPGDLLREVTVIFIVTNTEYEYR